MKTIILPDANEITRRLAEKFGDGDHDKKLWREIARFSGTERNGVGVFMIVSWAIRDYISKGGYPAAMEAVLSMQIPDFIKALVDDDEVRRDALSFSDEVNERLGIKKN